MPLHLRFRCWRCPATDRPPPRGKHTLTYARPRSPTVRTRPPLRTHLWNFAGIFTDSAARTARTAMYAARRVNGRHERSLMLYGNACLALGSCRVRRLRSTVLSRIVPGSDPIHLRWSRSQNGMYMSLYVSTSSYRRK